jgi:phospholipase C
MRADLSMSNIGPHVAKSSHFAVYNNAAVMPSFAQYPKHAPSQFTIDPVRWSTDAVTVETVKLGQPSTEGRYDLTVIGPNRFMRRFTGNVVTGDITSRVHVDYYPHGLHRRPVLAVTIHNGGGYAMTFTLHANHYRYAAIRKPIRIRVPAYSDRKVTIDPLRYTGGWYDVTVRVTDDHTWSRRYVGHLETGRPSITGSS